MFSALDTFINTLHQLSCKREEQKELNPKGGFFLYVYNFLISKIASTLSKKMWLTVESVVVSNPTIIKTGRKTTTHVLNNLYSEETNLINELSLVATHTPDCHCQNKTVNNKESSTKCSLLNRKIHFTDLQSLVVNCQFDCQFKHCLISTKNVSVLLILCTVSGTQEKYRYTKNDEKHIHNSSVIKNKGMWPRCTVVYFYLFYQTFHLLSRN